MKFRKKPVVIEAVQHNCSPKIEAQLLEWIGDSARIEHDGNHSTNIVISTLEGDMVANRCDWIIKGAQGEFYLCKPDIFEATYEKVED